MEIGFRRCFQGTQACCSLGSLHRDWCSGSRNVNLHNWVCSAWLPQPFEPWIPFVFDHRPLYHHGLPSWICVGSVLQDVQGCRHGSTQEHSHDGHGVPGSGIQHLFHVEFDSMGGQGDWCCAIRNFGSFAVLLVCNVLAPRVLGQLLGLQEGSGRVSGPHESNPSSGTRPDLVHEDCTQCSHGRSIAIRCCFRGALLHLVIHMATPLLLSFRIHEFGPHYSAANLRRDHDSHDLLPALC
mmetsp:Transcript_20417/g.31914  ORF Transcript_20417/g.31914 Transcript_20417/m.31914 type:complete len:239 (-) Transcript_20417:420-1136(-)